MIQRSNYMDKEKILEFCKLKHKDQKRKGGEPYINHLIETAKVTTDIANELLDKYPYLKKEIDAIYVTGLLHDTIEDTSTDYEDILELTNEKVASWILCLSDDKRLPSAIRRFLYFNEISNSSIEVKIIKLADIFSNLNGINRKEGKMWILEFMKKAKMTLTALQPELFNTKYYQKCQDIINVLEKELNQK